MAEPERVGPEVPGYRLIRPLSEASMAAVSRVFLAEETFGERRRVAVKILNLAGARPDIVERFRDEIRIAWELRHPNIVEMYHAGESAGYHYLVMRYVDGPDLEQLLREQGRLDIARTVEIARQIADALDAAHSRLLVHRDVKPGNILLDATSGQAYLCDFGIVKDLRSRSLTRYGVPLTPLYAPPEQQDGRLVNHRTDIYALAGVIYHCLTGRPAFDGFTTQEVYEAHRSAPPPTATDRPGLPSEIDEVFRRGLAKHPEHRYASCAELVADLTAVLGGLPRPLLPPLPRSVRSGRARTRLPGWMRSTTGRVVAVAVVAVLVATTLAILQPWQGEPATGASGPLFVAFPSTAERSLINLVGDGGCQRAPTTETRGFSGVLAAVDCTPPGAGATSESYIQFRSLTELRDAFNRDVAAAKAPNGADCSQGTAPGFLGNRRYDLRSVDLGGLLCHPGPNSGLIMEWSVEPLRVLGRAVGPGGSALAGWWRNYYGPPTSAIVNAVNREATPRFPTPAESALLAHIPPASRSNCVRPSDRQVKLNVGNTPVIAVVCGPTSGAEIVFYYQFSNDTAMYASYGVPELDGADCTTIPSGFEGEHAYSRNGETGRLQCMTDDDTKVPSIVWTDDRLAVEGIAFQGGDPQAMIDWWRNDAGPS